MGPVLDPDTDQTGFLRAVDALARSERLAMVEIEHPMLDPAALLVAGFERVPDLTYMVTLDPDPLVMWRAMASTCRNRIRKAEAADLIVEDVDDPAVVDEYYDLYRDLMRRKGRRPPFGREVARALYAHLRPADALLALRVRDQEGRVLAVGLFPHGAGTLYFWSGASREDGHHLCPNDLMHWTAHAPGCGPRAARLQHVGPRPVQAKVRRPARRDRALAQGLLAERPARPARVPGLVGALDRVRPGCTLARETHRCAQIAPHQAAA